MGLLRILLALSVVITHAPSRLQSVFLGGSVAVQGFFIISGFYMALVLDRKYNFKGATPLFYQQRYLRLAPLYWISVLITLAAAVLHTITIHRPSGAIIAWVSHGTHLSPFTLAALVVSQVSLLGIDILSFFRISGSPLHFSSAPDFHPEPLSSVHFMIVPQAWSISLELLFYLVAPFFLRCSTKFLALLILASFALRLAGYKYFGLFEGGWNNRFFPFEIGLFLTGSLSYRCLGVAERFVRSHPPLCIAAAAFFFGSICFHRCIPLSDPLADWFFLACLIVMVPILFAATQNWKVDRWIGELSYPLYLLHLVTIYSIFSLITKTTGILHECVILGSSLLVAVAAQILLESRFDALRARIFRSKTKARPLPQPLLVER